MSLQIHDRVDFNASRRSWALRKRPTSASTCRSRTRSQSHPTGTIDRAAWLESRSQRLLPLQILEIFTSTSSVVGDTVPSRAPFAPCCASQSVRKRPAPSLAASISSCSASCPTVSSTYFNHNGRGQGDGRTCQLQGRDRRRRVLLRTGPSLAAWNK